MVEKKMTFFKMCFFQKILFGIFFLFTGLMAIVACYAYSRTSGFTRQDMAEAQFMRQKAVVEKRTAEEVSLKENTSIK